MTLQFRSDRNYKACSQYNRGLQFTQPIGPRPMLATWPFGDFPLQEGSDSQKKISGNYMTERQNNANREIEAAFRQSEQYQQLEMFEAGAEDFQRARALFLKTPIAKSILYKYNVIEEEKKKEA